jgi:choline dehydrogenase-like flavoprotein
MGLKSETGDDCECGRSFSNSFNAVVIGAGSTGLAVTETLLSAGVRDIGIVDAGSVQDSRNVDVRGFPNTSEENDSDKPNSPGAKAWFGSYAAYKNSFRENLVFDKRLSVRPSRYFGGFSRIWGATFDFYSQADKWPVGTFPSSEDIQFVSSLVAHSETSFLPGDLGQSGKIAGNKGAGEIADKLVRLRHTQFDVKKSVLAVNTENRKFACVLSGECIEGCPKNAIWFAGEAFTKCEQVQEIKILDGFLVLRISSDSSSEVNIFTICKKGGHHTISGKYCFLAAGPIATGKILIDSCFFDSLNFRDTATIFTVGLSLKQETKSPHHALSQFWVKPKDEYKCGVSAQIYPPSNVLKNRLPKGLVRAFAKSLVLILENNLYPIIAYSSARDSASFSMWKDAGQIRVSGRNSVFGISKICLNLVKLFWNLTKGGLFVPWMVKFTPPGTGFHFGSSLPHGSKSDYLGRIPKLENVSIVDASVLPNIELGSITPTVMANAVRITRTVIKEGLLDI